jgi:hypothetical protein
MFFEDGGAERRRTGGSPVPLDPAGRRKRGATQSDVTAEIVLVLVLFLFLFRQEWAGRKRKIKNKEERERVRVRERERFRR